MGLQILQFLLVDAQPVLHVGRHTVQVLDWTVTISEHGPGTVITRDDDEMVCCVKDVVNGGSRLIGVHLLLDQLHVDSRRCHQLAFSHLAGSILLRSGPGGCQVNIGTKQLH